MKAFIEITQSNRTTFRRPLEGSKISLGRSSRCDISLPEEQQLQAEHLLIIPEKTGCQVELASQAPTSFSFQGQPMQKGLIPWGEDIYVDKIRFRMVRGPSKTDRKLINRQFIFAVFPLLCASAWLLLNRSPADDSSDPGNVVASPLFNPPIECTQPRLALHRAGEAERAAFAKMERYPYVYQDGVAAVGLISEARDCYQTEEKTAHVTRVQKTLDTWRRRLERDYRNHRLQLRLALSDAQYEKARRTARILRSLLSHRDDSYTIWLGRVERNPNAY